MARARAYCSRSKSRSMVLLKSVPRIARASAALAPLALAAAVALLAGFITLFAGLTFFMLLTIRRPSILDVLTSHGGSIVSPRLGLDTCAIITQRHLTGQLTTAERR